MRLSLTNRVLPVSSNKLNSLVINNESMRFSSKHFLSIDEFEAAWPVKWTLATKLRIKHDSIRSITKEEGDPTFRIVYRTYVGIPSECEFSFADESLSEAFIAYMEKEQYFTKTDGPLSPLKAASRYALGLAFMIFATWFCWYLVVDAKHGGRNEGTGAKDKVFFYILGLLGEKGVLAVGIGSCIYIGFRMWQRVKNPPCRVKLVK